MSRGFHMGESGGNAKTKISGVVTFSFGRPVGGYTYVDITVTLSGNTIFSERLAGNALPSTITRTFVNNGYTFTLKLLVGSGNNGYGQANISNGSETALDVQTPEFVNTVFSVSYGYDLWV